MISSYPVIYPVIYTDVTQHRSIGQGILETQPYNTTVYITLFFHSVIYYCYIIWYISYFLLRLAEPKGDPVSKSAAEARAVELFGPGRRLRVFKLSENTNPRMGRVGVSHDIHYSRGSSS